MKRLYFLLLLVIISISTLSYAEKTNVQPEKIIKIYPTTTGDFWSILKGTEVEILNKKSENNYSFWSLSGSWDDTDTNSETITSPNSTSDRKQDATAYSLGIGYGNISYTSHKTWDSFNKNRISFDYKHTGSKTDTTTGGAITTTVSDRNSDVYTLAYSYSLGVEKKIIDQFGLGVEAEVFNASISYNNQTEKNTLKDSVVISESNDTQNRWKANTQVLGSFKVYAKINF